MRHDIATSASTFAMFDFCNNRLNKENMVLLGDVPKPTKPTKPAVSFGNTKLMYFNPLMHGEGGELKSCLLMGPTTNKEYAVAVSALG